MKRRLIVVGMKRVEKLNKGHRERRQAWETRRQQEPRVEIMKGDKLEEQGGSGSQEQPKSSPEEIRKGDKLGRQGGSGRQEWRS